MNTLPFMKSYRDALNRIPDPAIRWEAFEIIQDYAFYDAEPDEEQIKASCGEYAIAVLIALDLIRPLIDKKKSAAEAHRIAGAAGGRPRKQEEEKPNKTKLNQTKPNSTDKDMELEKDNGKKEKEKELERAADRIIVSLNDHTGKKFTFSDTNRKLIIARMRDGYSEAECYSVVRKMSRKWNGTPMADYLRPKTLFAISNFEGYLNAPEEKDGSRPPARQVNPSAHNFDERKLDYDSILRQEEAERAKQEATA